MSEVTKDRKVRIVDGLQQGAEFSLKPGMHCVIGSDPSCMAVLLDADVAPKHCVISMDGSKVTCTAIEAPVTIGDKVIEPSQTVTITDFQNISVGTASIAVGPVNADWRQGLEAASLLQRRSSQALWHKPYRLAASLAIGIIGVVGVLGLAYGVMSSDRTEMNAARLEEAKRWLKTVAPVGSELKLAVDNHQHLVVSGYVGSSYERELLTMATHDSPFRPRTEIFAVEEIMSAIARFSRLEGIPCVAQYAGEGKVNCTNQVENSLSAAKLKSVAQQVPGLKSLDVAYAPVVEMPKPVAIVPPPEQKPAVPRPLKITKKFSVMITKKEKILLGPYGDKYQEGDEFDGFRIEKIEIDKVTFQRDGRDYPFYVAAMK